MQKLYTLKELAFRVQLPESLVARYLRLHQAWQGYPEDSVEFVLQIHERGLTQFELLLDRALAALDLIGDLNEMLQVLSPQGGSLGIDGRSHSKADLARTLGIGVRKLDGVIKEFEGKYGSLRRLGRGYDSASAWALKVFWWGKQEEDLPRQHLRPDQPVGLFALHREIVKERTHE